MHAHAHQHQPRRRKRERCGEAKGLAPSSAQLVPASRPSPWPPAAQVRPRVRPMRPCTRPSRGSRRRGRLAADQVTLAADQVAQPSATSTTSSASSMQPEQASMHGASRLEPGRTHDAGRTDRSTAAQRCLTPAFCTTGPEHGGDAAADRAPLAVEAREEESSVAGARPARGSRGAHATEAHRASLLICAAECSICHCARARADRTKLRRIVTSTKPLAADNVTWTCERVAACPQLLTAEVRRAPPRAAATAHTLLLCARAPAPPA